jgi:predicted RNA binding protein YcfA (HicA-like mRNA interferase family)
VGLESIDSLKHELPHLFKDRPVPEGFEDDWVIIPTDSIDRIEDEFAGILEEFFHDRFDAEGTVGPTGWGDEFPGSPVWGTPQGVPGSAAQPPSDAMAFYLPFHYFHPDWWGIYLTLEGMIHLARDIQARLRGPAIPPRDLIRISKIFLYRHEFFHHKTETWATRTEIVSRGNPLYTGPYENEYRRVAGSDDCTEEAVANAYAYDEVKKAIKKPDFNITPPQRQCVLDALGEHIRAQPPGYRVAAAWGSRGMLSPAKMKNGERRLAEEYWQSAFGPRPKLSGDAWAVFSHAFTGITNKLSRTNYVIRKGSLLHRRAQLGRLFSLRKIKSALTRLNCHKMREGGGHEIWIGPSGKQTSIPRHRGEIPKGTLKAILNQLGLPLSISEFQQVLRA